MFAQYNFIRCQTFRMPTKYFDLNYSDCDEAFEVSLFVVSHKHKWQ